MTLIQPILVFLLIAGMVIYVRALRSRLVDRVLVLMIVAVGTVFVAFPEWTNLLAHRVGVGRGADLMTYLGVAGGGFCLLLLLSKIRDLEGRVTELTRVLAVRQAKRPRED